MLSDYALSAPAMPAPLQARIHDHTALQIALVTETYPPEVNGVAHTLQHMVNGMLARGHQVHLIRPRQGRDDQQRVQAGLTEHLHPGLPIPGYKGLHFGLPARSALVESWQHNPPDIVYIATEGPLGRSALNAARQLRIPVISGFHTNFHGYSRYYGLGFLEPAIGGILRRFHNRTACTLVPTQALRTELQASGFQRCEVLARGVDTQLFSPQRRDAGLRHAWGVDEHTLVVMYVGRLAAEKNLSLAVESFRLLQLKRPEARFVLVGDGPELRELKRLHPDFIFCGMRTGEDLARHYASGDVFLFPSLSETFGNVVLEAMASGLAIVAFDYAAAHEHLIHGEHALLAPFADHGAFIRLAQELAQSPEYLNRLRLNARELAQSIDWSTIYNRLEQLFKDHATRGRCHATITENE
ncbi:glycosyltransferase family 4 protein [Thiorhodospira sibirica]|uniref:glycosyltransferase family 4 protein n=1 Tax=Thiorhodospira sibirica TaxID=154347 RepID=UPI00022C0B3E|nr:glycosyltransferase family 1 protein [Thiorhodospira sibirica]